MLTQSDMSGQGRMIAVFGASGHTGRFMVAQLLSRGFVPIAIGRDSAKMTAAGFQEGDVQIRTASIDDPASLDRSLAGAAAVINCAGPFLDTADAVAAAALRARIHYLDVTAEQPSAHAIFDRFGAAATEAGVVFIPAMGFYGGFADLLATAVMDNWDSADEIRLGIALDSWRPTQGTRITGQRNTARRLVIEDGKLVPLAQPAPQTFWDFPEPFGRQDVSEVPFSEVSVIGRHLRSDTPSQLPQQRAASRSSRFRPPRPHRSLSTKEDDRRRPSWSTLLFETEAVPAERSRKDATSMPSLRRSSLKPSSEFSTDGPAAAVSCAGRSVRFDGLPTGFSLRNI